MSSRKHFTKKRLFGLATALIIYAALWFVTHELGTPRIRTIAIQEMNIPSTYADLTEKGQKIGPIYDCSARAYAPFLIRADYGWHAAPLYGNGGSALYLWFFGRTARIKEIDHWSE